MNMETVPYQKTFSLSSAARYLKVGKQTLQSMLIRGEIQHTTNDAGDHVIPGAEVFRLEQQFEAERSQAVTAADVDRLRAESTPPSLHIRTGSEPVSDPRPGPVQSGAESGLAGLPPNLVPRDLHDQLLAEKDRRIEEAQRREQSVEKERDAWKVQAEVVQKLLTFQAESTEKNFSAEQGRGVEPQIDVVLDAPASNKSLIGIFLVLAATGTGGAFIAFQDQILEWFQNL